MGNFSELRRQRLTRGASPVRFQASGVGRFKIQFWPIETPTIEPSRVRPKLNFERPTPNPIDIPIGETEFCTFEPYVQDI
jgi:hypothetical protein